MADATLTETAVEVDNLVIEAGEVVDRTILTGQELERGTSLTKVPTLAAGAATAGGSNVGDGVAGTVTLGDYAEVGIYTLTCTAESADAGTFSVLTPSGYYLADLTVASAYTSQHINLTIADGAEDFDTGDVFTIAVTESGAKYSKTVAGGSIDGILKDDIDTTSGDATGSIYYTGVYNERVVEDKTGISVTEAMQDTARKNGLMVGTR